MAVETKTFGECQTCGGTGRRVDRAHRRETGCFDPGCDEPCPNCTPTCGATEADVLHAKRAGDDDFDFAAAARAGNEALRRLAHDDFPQLAKDLGDVAEQIGRDTARRMAGRVVEEVLRGADLATEPDRTVIAGFNVDAWKKSHGLIDTSRELKPGLVWIDPTARPICDEGFQLRCVRCDFGIGEGEPRVPVYSGGTSEFLNGKPVHDPIGLSTGPRVHFRCLESAECERVHAESHAAAVAHFEEVIRHDPEKNGWPSCSPGFEAEDAAEIARIRAAGPPGYSTDPEAFDP